MTHRCKILADDLTGACDTGVAFALRGLRVIVSLDGVPLDCDVPVVSTASRNDEAGTAYEKVRTACERLEIGAKEPFYKKIDSTLRGPVIAELQACLDAGARTPGVFCPAFPEQGRTVSGGQLRAPGLRVDLANLLGVLPLETPDAVTVADLDSIAARMFAEGWFPFAAGSAGLARAFAARLAPEPTAPPNAPEPGDGPVILCIGSDHPVTLGQIAHYRESGGAAELHTIRFDERPPIGHALESMDRGGLFFCGGDTAAYVCTAFGARAIELEGEVAPGIPLGRLIGGAGHGLAVVTKSGGFGKPDTLSCVVQVLSAQNRKNV